MEMKKDMFSVLNTLIRRIGKARPNKINSIVDVKIEKFNDNIIEPHGKYFDENIRKKALKDLQVVISTIFDVRELKVSLRFICTQNNDTNRKNIEKSIEDCRWIINVLTSFKPPPSRELFITLIDVDSPKRVQWADIPNAYNVNTGFYMIGQNIIYVYRREEMIKTLIHEMVHYWIFELDETYNANKNELRQYFGIYDLNFNESYVDSIAIFLNFAFYCIKNGIVAKENIERLWVDENEHMVKRALCISINYWEIFGARTPKLITEKTNAMSYYVIKAALFCDPEYTFFLLNHLISGKDMTRIYYTIIKRQIMDTSSIFWGKLREVYLKQSLCKDGDSLTMSSLEFI